MEQASTDPRRLFTAFRAGTIYHAAWDQFFHGRSLAGDVTEAEQRAVFKASDAAKLALIDYVRLKAPFGYDPASYATSTAAAIDTYIAHVQHIRKRMAERVDRDEIMEMDRTRSTYHRRAAQAMLDEGITTSITLGRTLARLILVHLGVETYEDARHMV
jgi:hypothetical protein